MLKFLEILEFREFEVKTPEDKEKFRCEGDGCFCLLKGLMAYCVEHVEDDVDTPFCSYFCSAAHRKETVEEWRALGVTPYSSLPPGTLVSLFQPDGPGTSAWLLTSNYRVILEYNCSNYYAMSVGLLADEIAN